jgi:hypothetical protein
MFDRRKSEEFIELVRSEMSAMDEDIPEPDWSEFRMSVRDRLLSRSVQRSSAARRWTAWSTRPTFAWALSLIVAVAITTGAFWWKLGNQPYNGATELVPQAMSEVSEWPQPGLFDDLVELGANEEEQLRQMLEAAQ